MCAVPTACQTPTSARRARRPVHLAECFTNRAHSSSCRYITHTCAGHVTRKGTEADAVSGSVTSCTLGSGCVYGSAEACFVASIANRNNKYEERSDASSSMTGRLHYRFSKHSICPGGVFLVHFVLPFCVTGEHYGMASACDVHIA